MLYGETFLIVFWNNQFRKFYFYFPYFLLLWICFRLPTFTLLGLVTLSQFSRSVMFYSLWPHGLQHTRPPCPWQLLELAQTQVHRVGNAIWPSRSLWFTSPPAFSLSQHQGLFQWVSSFHQVAKVLELQLQHQSFHWIFRTYFHFEWTGLISLPSKGLSRVFTNTTVQKHQFFGTQLFL